VFNDLSPLAPDTDLTPVTPRRDVPDTELWVVTHSAASRRERGADLRGDAEQNTAEQPRRRAGDGAGDDERRR
jgi:hypothetical protein